MLQDIRYAARWLRRSPGFTAVAVLSLALGIGFNTALFSVLDAVLFRPLPVAAPDRLVDVYTSGSDGDTYATTSYPDFLDFKAHNSVFDDMMAYSAMMAAINLPDRSRLALGEVVTGNYFQVLGVGAALGRTLLPEDDREGAERVAVLSHRAWVRDHGSDPAVLGRSLRMRGQPYTIVGVVPQSFTGMVPVLAPELWITTAHVGEVEPAGIQDIVPSPGTDRLDRRGQRWLFVKGRLRDGATVDQARANLGLLMTQFTAAYPDTNKDRAVAVLATRDVRIHPEADRALVPAGIGLMVAVGLVLAIACANVASMLLARAAGRQREIGIRLALGAGRGRLIRQLLTESLLLSALGAAGGLALAAWITRFVTTLDLPIPIPVAFDIRIDGRVLGFTIAVSLLAGFVAGLAPALKASKRSLVGALKGETLVSDVGGRRWTLRDGLVAAQIATTVILLVAAGLLTRSLAAAQDADPGFRTSGIAIVSADVDMLRYDEERARQFWDTALERVQAMPGVDAAAVAARLPLSINFNQAIFFVPGHHAPGDRGTNILSSRVSSGYFDALDVPILAGRTFNDTTDAAGTPGVIIVSESLARRFWPGESAVGRRLHTRGLDGPAFEIVGVAADYKVRSIGETPQPYVHFAYSQLKSPYQVLMVRSRLDAQQTLAQVRRELLAMEPNLAFLDNQTMDDQVSVVLYPARAAAWVVSIVGMVAMLLAAIGLYGVIAYSVARRTREIGIRMALGARPASVLGLVLRQGMTVAIAGLVAGSLLAILAARAVSGALYGVSAADPLAWLGAVGTILLISTAANLVPARRAAAVAPSVALRSD